MTGGYSILYPERFERRSLASLCRCLWSFDFPFSIIRVPCSRDDVEGRREKGTWYEKVLFRRVRRGSSQELGD